MPKALGWACHDFHGWGGGIDFTYWFPWKYAGVRFQGAGLDIEAAVTKQRGHFREGNCNCARRRRQCGSGCGYGRLHVAAPVG